MRALLFHIIKKSKGTSVFFVPCNWPMERGLAWSMRDGKNELFGLHLPCGLLSFGMSLILYFDFLFYACYSSYTGVFWPA